MPCVQQVMKQGDRKSPCPGQVRPAQKSLYEYATHPGQTPTRTDLSPPAVIEVGKSRFIIESGDNTLIEELRLFCESLKGSPRAEIRFTNRLFACTEQGRLRPWGWQQQPCRTG